MVVFEGEDALSNVTSCGRHMVGGSLLDGLTPTCAFRLQPKENSLPSCVITMECQYPAATLLIGEPTTCGKIDSTTVGWCMKEGGEEDADAGDEEEDEDDEEEDTRGGEDEAGE